LVCECIVGPDEKSVLLQTAAGNTGGNLAGFDDACHIFAQ